MGRLALRLCFAGALFAPAGWLACSSFASDPTPDTSTDAATPIDVTPPIDAPPPGDGLTSFADATNWTTFDVAQLFPESSGWGGSAFDGRYMYFSPYVTTVVRYDTTKTFEDKTSWEKFDVTPLGARAGCALSAVVASGFVYFLPSFNYAADRAAPRMAYRFDQKGTFSAAASWQAISFDDLGDGGIAPTGGVVAVDPNTLFAVPFDKSNTPTNPTDAAPAFATFDTRSSFTSPDGGGWAVGPKQPPIVDFSGAVAVDGLVYAGSLVVPRLVRFLPSDAGSADSFFLPIDGGAGTFNGSFGIVSDGRYVYLPPLLQGNVFNGSILARCDTKTFAATSCETLDLLKVGPGLQAFAGGTFDGRFLYLAPLGSGQFVRYDTTKPFVEPSSYEIFNSVAAIGANILRESAAFDGQYVYFPSTSTSDRRIVRFKARTDRSPWPAATSSN